MQLTCTFSFPSTLVVFCGSAACAFVAPVATIIIQSQPCLLVLINLLRYRVVTTIVNK